MAEKPTSLSDRALRELRTHKGVRSRLQSNFNMGGLPRRSEKAAAPKITLRRADYERQKEQP